MNRLKLSVFSCVFAIVLAAMLLTTEGAGAAPLSCGMWRIVPSPSPGSSAMLNGVAAVSENNIWAVGVSSNTLVEHWNGTSWKVISSPGKGAALNDVAAVSANDIWAVGNTFNSGGIAQTLTEHWNGTSWRIIPSPNIGMSFNFLLGVAVISTNDVWAVGIFFSNGTQQTLTEHWNGTSWQVVKSPDPGSTTNTLEGVTAVSAHSVWALGAFYNAKGVQQTLTEHWNGMNWQVVPSPNFGSGVNNALLSAVHVPGTGGIWAVGSTFFGEGSSQTITEFFC